MLVIYSEFWYLLHASIMRSGVLSASYGMHRRIKSIFKKMGVAHIWVSVDPCHGGPVHFFAMTLIRPCVHICVCMCARVIANKFACAPLFYGLGHATSATACFSLWTAVVQQNILISLISCPARIVVHKPTNMHVLINCSGMLMMFILQAAPDLRVQKDDDPCRFLAVYIHV